MRCAPAHLSGKHARYARTLIPALLVIAGLVLLLRPVVSDWLFAQEAADATSRISAVYDEMGNADRLENLAQAHAWNSWLYGGERSADLWDYRQQLTYKSSPESMIAWIDIPKIAVHLPIYHGTGDAELMAGVGHYEWSALPVGGMGTRCVLTAHSGMQDTRMFDDIRKLQTGDTFVLWTLGEPYAYKVREITECLPDAALNLLRAREPQSDLCTLVTCTPYGINTHRLLVTGERCEYEGEETPQVGAYVNRRTLPVLAALAELVATGIVICLVIKGRRRTNA